MCPVCYYHEIAGLIQPKLSMFSTCNHWFQAPSPPVFTDVTTLLSIHLNPPDLGAMHPPLNFHVIHLKNGTSKAKQESPMSVSYPVFQLHNTREGSEVHHHQVVDRLGCLMKTIVGASPV